MKTAPDTQGQSTDTVLKFPQTHLSEAPPPSSLLGVNDGPIPYRYTHGGHGTQVCKDEPDCDYMEAFDLHKYYTVSQPHPLPHPQAQHTAETWSGQLQPARSKRSARLGRWVVTTRIGPNCPCPHACKRVLACTLNSPTCMYTGVTLSSVDHSSSDSLSSLSCGTALSQTTVVYPFPWSRVSGAGREGGGVLVARHCGWAEATSSLTGSPSQRMHLGRNLVDVSKTEGYFSWLCLEQLTAV